MFNKLRPFFVLSQKGLKGDRIFYQSEAEVKYSAKLYVILSFIHDKGGPSAPLKDDKGNIERKALL